MIPHSNTACPGAAHQAPHKTTKEDTHTNNNKLGDVTCPGAVRTCLIIIPHSGTLCLAPAHRNQHRTTEEDTNTNIHNLDGSARRPGAAQRTPHQTLKEETNTTNNKRGGAMSPGAALICLIITPHCGTSCLERRIEPRTTQQKMTQHTALHQVLERRIETRTKQQKRTHTYK